MEAHAVDKLVAVLDTRELRHGRGHAGQHKHPPGAGEPATKDLRYSITFRTLRRGR
jgi:hypothetical protein